jgi:hypothetical protein
MFSIAKIDRLIAAGTTAEIHDPGRKGLKNQVIDTFRGPRGEVWDQFMVTGSALRPSKFVIAFNRRSAVARFV